MFKCLKLSFFQGDRLWSNAHLRQYCRVPITSLYRHRGLGLHIIAADRTAPQRRITLIDSTSEMFLHQSLYKRVHLRLVCMPTPIMMQRDFHKSCIFVSLVN